jgi:hypothetical protein
MYRLVGIRAQVFLCAYVSRARDVPEGQFGHLAAFVTYSEEHRSARARWYVYYLCRMALYLPALCSDDAVGHASCACRLRRPTGPTLVLAHNNHDVKWQRVRRSELLYEDVERAATVTAFCCIFGCPGSTSRFIRILPHRASRLPGRWHTESTRQAIPARVQ